METIPRICEAAETILATEPDAVLSDAMERVASRGPCWPAWLGSSRITADGSPPPPYGRYEI